MLHGANRILAAQKRAVQIGRKYSTPVLEVCMFRIVSNRISFETSNPGVVHHDIQFAVSFHHCFSG